MRAIGHRLCPTMIGPTELVFSHLFDALNMLIESGLLHSTRLKLRLVG